MEKSARLGRPPSGNARSGTQRVKDSDAALIASGGKVIRTLRLSPEAGEVFDELRKTFGTDKEVFEFALLYFRKPKDKPKENAE